ncbi:MAG: 5-guanidino-2-oxopentanoate decarboxylase [Gammaproteobacteria bacterium]|jgi:acetolactate synthase-1/2/3 large subunit|nr:5-guanidino-2-oxopentanoate decarboxylase [Gammaproteobacteria bacterium]
MATCGEVLVKLLEAYGVDTVFGIPGVHTVELYRGLPDTRIRHVTPRHEQGAGFMADGYARVTGKPGVCFLITGPGVTNAATAMGQAYSDSIPMLVISAVNNTQDLGMGVGRLHELPDQRNVTAGYTVFSHTLFDPLDLAEVLARAFASFSGERPGPVHIEIPVNIITQEVQFLHDDAVICPKPSPDHEVIQQAARELAQAVRPVVLLGGGSVDASIEARELIQKLGAPVFLTLAAKGVVDETHPLCAGATLPFDCARKIIAEADVVLAVATEFSETDRNLAPEPIKINGRLIRIDIEAEQLMRTHRPDLPILGDARKALAALNKALAEEPVVAWEGKGAELVAGLKKQIAQGLGETVRRRVRLLEALREALPPDAILATDSTQLAYEANHHFPVAQARGYITCTTGFGTLGWALPAAIGARLGAPERPVVCVIGDGGLQFTLCELASAVEAGVALAVIVWNNDGYGEIRDYMQAKGLPLIGVDLYTPDFVAAGRALGCHAHRATSLEHIVRLVLEAGLADRPTLIEVRETDTYLDLS